MNVITQRLLAQAHEQLSAARWPPDTVVTAEGYGVTKGCVLDFYELAVSSVSPVSLHLTPGPDGRYYLRVTAYARDWTKIIAGGMR